MGSTQRHNTSKTVHKFRNAISRALESITQIATLFSVIIAPKHHFRNNNLALKHEQLDLPPTLAVKIFSFSQMFPPGLRTPQGVGVHRGDVFPLLNRQCSAHRDLVVLQLVPEDEDGVGDAVVFQQVAGGVKCGYFPVLVDFERVHVHDTADFMDDIFGAKRQNGAADFFFHVFDATEEVVL